MFFKTNSLPIAFGLICIIGLCALRIADPFFVKSVRETAFDQFQRVSPREFVNTPVRIVDIDEESLRQYGQWPWSRNRMADLTERLGQMGAAAIAFDILFVEPDRLSPSRLVTDPALSDLIDPAIRGRAMVDYDAMFAEQLAAYPTVLGFAMVDSKVDGKEAAKPEPKSGFAYTDADPAEAVPYFSAVTGNLGNLQAAASGLGSISLSPSDSVSVVRKVPLLWTDGERLYPSLVIESLRVAQGISTIVVHAVADSGTLIQAIRVGDFQIPTTPDGEIWMHYSEETRDRYVSARDILADEVEQSTVDAINGNIVLVGTSAVGLYDIRATAIGENVPGVSIHAQILEQIISSSYVYRGDWVDGMEIFGFVVVAIYVVFTTMAAGPILSLFVGGIVAGGVAVGTWLAYTGTGLLVDPTFPMGGGFVVYLAMISFRFFVADRQKRQIRRAFSQYVAPAVLDQIDKDAELSLGGEMREITIMFVDVRNFTSFSEMLPPVEVVLFLNALLGRLSEEIIRERGTIDKYIGDSVMAFWNAPIEIPDHEILACRAALRMRNALDDFNGSRLQGDTGQEAIAIGVGINTGQGCVGNMGSSTRFDYSVIGDSVNVASRVEAASKQVGFDIVISGATAAGLSGFAILEAGRIALKGKRETVPVYIVIGDEDVAQSAEFIRLETAHVNLLGALRHGAPGWEGRILTCKDLARTFLPQLTGFYDIIPTRLGDFADRQPAPIIAAVE